MPHGTVTGLPQRVAGGVILAQVQACHINCIIVLEIDFLDGMNL